MAEGRPEAKPGSAGSRSAGRAPAGEAVGEASDGGGGIARGRLLVVLVLFLLSGASGLIYEVLWVRALGLLFGNTVHATATTVAAFLLGLAAGARYWGRRGRGFGNPLAAYGWMEVTAGLLASTYFLVLPFYRSLFPAVYPVAEDLPLALLGLKFVLASIAILPSTFLLGGTFPVISQLLAGGLGQLGLKASLAHGVNTAGAAMGTVLAGFVLPLRFGFSATFLTAMALSIGVGLSALLLARGPWGPAAAPGPAASTGRARLAPAVAGLAFLSGFLALGMQVLWTRMFAQVLQNSVYTFSTVVLVFLGFLALGAGVANVLMRCRVAPERALRGLLLLSALCVGGSPFLFDLSTGGLGYLGGEAGWAGYLLRTAAAAVLVMGMPILVLGAVFPMLIRLSEGDAPDPAGVVGGLTAYNTVGAVAGALAVGFLVIELLGVWAGTRLIAVAYALAALFTGAGAGQRRNLAMPVVAVALLMSVLDPTRLPVVRFDPVERAESLVEVWEGSAATVAVIRRGDSLKIKVDNHYALGGTAARSLEELQGYLPILLHRDAKDVFVIGLGTGITAGGALGFPIETLTVAEVVPEVVAAAQKYFAPFSRGLFSDPRARIIEEDGRNFLAGTQRRFDVVIGDLFVPWKAGAGSLYTLEHFDRIRDRLREGGLFMQWLPAYQLSAGELGTIARTMLEVFPQVTVWRGDFYAAKPILGLLGSRAEQPLGAQAPLFRAQPSTEEPVDRVPLLAHYVANLSGSREDLARFPVNRDDRPVIELRAPVTHRRERAGEIGWFTGTRLLAAMETWQARVPPAHDGYLQLLPEERRVLVRAGMELHRSQVLRAVGEEAAAHAAFARFRNLLQRARLR